MASSWTRFAIVLLLHVILLMQLLPVHSDDADDHLLQGINSFRQSANVPPLAKHDNANCVAEEIADELEDQPCASNTASNTQLGNYQSLMKKCNIDINTTTDGVILPVCVHDRVAPLVLTNYTLSQNSRYLNNSRYTGVGMGHEDDWTVLVLTTNTPGGSFANKACLLNIITSSHLFVFHDNEQQNCSIHVNEVFVLSINEVFVSFVGKYLLIGSAVSTLQWGNDRDSNLGGDRQKKFFGDVFNRPHAYISEFLT
ncbi:unnamed protein product [Fraxinus pennsylvanica]|uniref:Uncharacterized GPI-anchored protein At5g19230-like domain-containing protein n=1 Tax=Fraxinus pennsylvanica TaxID=56036 RepID=A0AAD1ZFS0_9LAMI|nr:unnamed protein product [Fraxinus pennsylvanica]